VRTILSSIPTVKVFDVLWIRFWTALVPASILFGQRQHFIDRRPSIRHLFQPPVDQPVQPFRFMSHQATPKTALAYPEYPCRLGLGQPPLIPSFIRSFESHPETDSNLPYLL